MKVNGLCKLFDLLIYINPSINSKYYLADKANQYVNDSTTMGPGHFSKLPIIAT